MRVLVTGANGYIGSSLVRHLTGMRKYRVFALVRKGSNLNSLKEAGNNAEIITAVQSFDSIDSAVARSKPDVVVHLAALSLLEHRPRQIKPLVDSNITFPSLLLEAMVRNNVKRLIDTGTFWEYMRGTREYCPANLYAATKHAFKQILRYYEDSHDMKIVTLRLFGVYGPNDPRKKVFYFLEKSLHGKKAAAFSPGRQALDLIYIDDVVSAYRKAIEYVNRKRKRGLEEFSIGSGKGITLREIARIYGKCACGKTNIEWGALPYHKREIMAGAADIGSAAAGLGWKPRFGLKEGILEMLRNEKTELRA